MGLVECADKTLDDDTQAGIPILRFIAKFFKSTQS